MDGVFTGVLDIYYAEQTTAETASTAPVYGTPALLGKAIEVTITPTTNEGQLSASNKRIKWRKKITGYEISMNTDNIEPATLAKILAASGIDKREELFYRIGMGTLKVPNLQEVLKPSSGWGASLIGRIFRRQQKKQEEENTGYVIGGESGHRFVIASCCNPIPGDPVVGFKGPDGTITVHKKTCPVAESIASTHGDWMVVPSWIEENESGSFLVRISLKGIDRMGMVKDISSYLSIVMGANIRGLTLTSEDGIFDGFIDLYVSSRVVLEKIILQLSGIEGIKEVSRSEL